MIEQDTKAKIAAALMDALIRVLSHGYDIHDLRRTANDDNAPWRTDLSTLLISHVTRNETSMQLPQRHGLAHVETRPSQCSNGNLLNVLPSHVYRPILRATSYANRGKV